MKIAVVSIALNEKNFVERWAASAKDADYMIIGDTGSTDGTVDLARSLGVSVYNISIKPWRFDDARNALLALVPSDADYVINLDLDEILVDGWRDHLEKAKATRPRYTYTWSWANKEEKSPGLQYNGDKIVSRHGYRWQHPVHEVMVPDRMQETQEFIALEIHHHPDNSKPRSQYLPLLELAAKESPNDDRTAYYYARELFFYGQYELAAKEFKRHLGLPTASWAPERAASMRYLAKCERSKDWLYSAIKESPGRREALVELSNIFYTEQDWINCLKYALEALDIKEKPLDYLCEEFAWGSMPHDLASISEYNLGNIHEAISHLQSALTVDPGNQRLSENLKLMLKELQNNNLNSDIISE